MNNDDNLLITIDARETNIYNDIVSRDLDNYKDKIKIISENLMLGDIHITYKTLNYIGAEINYGGRVTDDRGTGIGGLPWSSRFDLS
jgi:hypothetical protein